MDVNMQEAGVQEAEVKELNPQLEEVVEGTSPDAKNETEVIPPKKDKKKIIILATTICAVSLVVIVLVMIFTNLIPKSVAKRYGFSVLKRDAVTSNSLLAYDLYAYLKSDKNGTVPDELFFEFATENYGKGKEINSWRDYAKVIMALTDEDLTEDYGKYIIKAKATECTDYTIEEFRSSYSSMIYEYSDYGFDIDDVKKMKLVTVEYGIIGEKDRYEGVTRVPVVKIKGRWKAFANN